MKSIKYKAVVTDLGNQLMVKAIKEGEKVSIYYLAVGDGNGARYEPACNMTNLKNELWRGVINSSKISSQHPNRLIISAVCPGNIGGFTIREMAVFDRRNRMIAICNTPDTPKVKITDGVVNELRLELIITLINGTEVELICNKDIQTASKKDITDLWDYLHENGKVLVGKTNTPLLENDKCIIADVLPWVNNTFQQVYIKSEQGNLGRVISKGHDSSNKVNVGLMQKPD